MNSKKDQRRNILLNEIYVNIDYLKKTCNLLNKNFAHWSVKITLMKQQIILLINIIMTDRLLIELCENEYRDNMNLTIINQIIYFINIVILVIESCQNAK